MDSFDDSIGVLSMTDRRFPKRVRLLSGSEFRQVLAARCSTADRMLVVFGAVNELGHSRLGLAVSRAVGSAVVRNRWKRAMREAFRLVQHELPPLDLVAIPRADVEPDVATIGRSLRVLTTRLQKKLATDRRGSADPPQTRKDSP